MVRLPRYALPGQPQHVVQRGNNRSTIFAADSDYEHFRECLRRAARQHGCAVHAYALMTNHVHLLITPSSATGIGKVMQSVSDRYVQRFNARSRRTGTLWEGRYRSVVVDSECYLLTCYRYIELNPVRAGIVRHPAEYRWSSYRANALGWGDAMVTPHELYLSLDTDASMRRATYRALCETSLDEATLCTVRAATHTGWAMGSDRFRDRITRVSGRRAAPLPRWRPT